MENGKFNVLVTAGGTTEPIDDVRGITNFSTGRFGHEMAERLAESGRANVTEICPWSTLERLGSHSLDWVNYEEMTTAENLERAMIEREEAPDIIIHAAAVADYAPVRTEGKIRSDSDELMITLQKTPKIIEKLRPTYGPTANIIGFKLLSNVSEEQLIEAAANQLKKNRLNMVIANDLKNIKDGEHPVLAVTAEGGVIPFSGERERVVRKLAEFILQRASTEWYVSTPDQEVQESAQQRALFEKTLNLAQSMNLLPDTSGNVSASLEARHLTVSPRQVDKSSLTASDGIAAHVHHGERTVNYVGSRKPSIDTGVSSYLYDTYPGVEAIMHFHDGWGRMNATTTFPYPCGSLNEAEEIIKHTHEKVLGPMHENLSVELVHHGFLLGTDVKTIDALRLEWISIQKQFADHMQEMGRDDQLDPTLLKPIFDGDIIAGIIYADKAGAAVYLDKIARGNGVGRRVVQQLIDRQYSIRTIDDCQVRDYYKQHGFSEVLDPETGIYTLTPPKRNRRDFM